MRLSGCTNYTNTAQDKLAVSSGMLQQLIFVLG